MKSESAEFDIRDVARLAGVSLGSASRAINGAPHVSAKTQAKVERAVAALGYKPNHAARALRSRLSRTIGCLVPDIANPLYAVVLGALEQKFRANGYMLLLASSGNDPRREVEALARFSQRGMDGVVIAPGHERDPALNGALAQLTMPVVIFDRVLPSPHDCLLIDPGIGIADAMRRLFQLGHRRIALVLSTGDSHPVRSRLDGYAAAYAAAGIAVPRELIVQIESVAASAFAEMAALLAGPDRPTAVIAPGTRALHSTLRAIASAGLAVPRDISVISVGDTDFAQEHEPALSVLALDVPEAARRMAGMLLGRIEGVELPCSEERVPLVYLERASVGPAPAVGGRTLAGHVEESEPCAR
jgi:LacI family transcriptional regulator